MQATGHPPGHAADEDGKSIAISDLVDLFDVAMTKAPLTAAARNNLDASDFAYTDSAGKGHFPIHDAVHARSAVAMFATHDFPDAATKKSAARRIMAAAKKFGIDVADDSPVATAAKSYGFTDQAVLRMAVKSLDAAFDALLAR